MQGSNAAASAAQEPAFNWTVEEYWLWEIVSKNSQDYASWEALINAVGKVRADPVPEAPTENIAKICYVYSNFLKYYPLCSEHRKAYAHYLWRFSGDTDALKVYVEAPELACNSVVFWLNFYELAVSVGGSYYFIEKLLEDAILHVGSHYDSKPLWELYIQLEAFNSNWKKVSTLYATVIENPIQGMEILFDQYKELIKTRPLNELTNYFELADIYTWNPNESIKLSEEDKVKNYVRMKEEAYLKAKAIKDKIIEFESSIKQFNFEPGRVEDDVACCWHTYLDFMEKEFPEKVWNLFKRCLIPCATRVDLWLRYIEFLEDKKQYIDANNKKQFTDAFFWAQHFAQKEEKLDVKLFTAKFKERIGDVHGALDEYTSIQKEYNPVPLKVLEAHANFQHRLGNDDGACGVFQDAIDAEIRNGSGLFSPALRLKFAHFALVVLDNPSKSKDILTGLLDLELDRPVVEGVIDIASSLPETERTEFLKHLDCILLKFVLADTNDDMLPEYSDKRDASLLYLQFLDYFGEPDTVDAMTVRHFSHFSRGNTMLPKRRLESVIDNVLSKKLKAYAGSPKGKKLDVIIMTLQEFLTQHVLIEDKLMNVGALQQKTFTKITDMGRRLLRAIYKVLLERHGCMLSWNGHFDARDIMVTYDGSPSSSIICSFRKEPEPSRAEDWRQCTKNDHITLQNILEQHFKSMITSTYPPFFSLLFTFALNAPATVDTEGSRTLFLDQIAQQPIFRSPSVHMTLCRDFHSFVKVALSGAPNWVNKYFAARGYACSAKFHKVLGKDVLIKQVFDTGRQLTNKLTLPDIGSGTIVMLIRQIEAHASDHFQKFSMSMNNPEDLYDLVDHHYAKFLQGLVIELCEYVRFPTPDPRLVGIYKKYSESD
ncbi:unnamed protein product [Urochloa humidicola]